MLVFDCETRTDETQALTFGSYRFLVAGRCLEEGLFYADDLTRGRARACWNATRASIRPTPIRAAFPSAASRAILNSGCCRSRTSARCSTAWPTRGAACLCAFNFPFDASRCALGYVASRDRFLGGFTFQFFQYRDRDGQLRAHPYRPGIAVKHMDSKRALKGFTGAIDPDKVDQIPEGDIKPKKGYVFRGHMLDLRTLAFALTDRSLSLEGACELFGVEHGKQKVEKHGIITPEYIDYNRRDVLASTELAAKLLAEYALHPIELQVTKAYSPGLDRQGVPASHGRDADHGTHAGFSEALLRLCRVGILRRPCERARAQGSGAGRLYGLPESVFHGECADGIVALRDGAGRFASSRTAARSSQRCCET